MDWNFKAGRHAGQLTNVAPKIAAKIGDIPDVSARDG
jgi:hypothetical protein